jgi:hypothetical protein
MKRVPYNWFVADAQQQDAAARRVLPAGQRQRYASYERAR